MGAIGIWMVLDGKLSKSDVESKIRDQMEEDREYNGHQEGYSGDWQTIGFVAFTTKVFNSKEDAIEYCNTNCEKRDGIAVKFKSVDDKSISKNKKILKLEELIKDCLKYDQSLDQKISETKVAILDETKSAKSKTIGCKYCDSSISRAYLKSMNCPVCQFDLTSGTNKSKLEKLSNKKEKVKVELNDLKEKYKKTKIELISGESGEEKWLIYGLAAC